MAIYRYSLESIDSLARKTRRQHAVGCLIFTAAVCAVGLALFELREAFIGDTVFALLMVVAWIGGRNKALQRIANLRRSTEIEIDDQKATWRSNLSTMDFYRSDIVEACFSSRGIWLRSKRRRALLEFSPEIEDFENLSGMLEEWLPQQVVRRDNPPSSLWTTLQIYGTWTGCALLLYVAATSQTRVVAIPACLLAGPGVAWYFAWCGRKIDERKWKVLLPATGYLLGALLLGRAFTLWVNR
jgi:hypothetical protein